MFELVAASCLVSGVCVYYDCWVVINTASNPSLSLSVCPQSTALISSTTPSTMNLGTSSGSNPK